MLLERVIADADAPQKCVTHRFQETLGTHFLGTHFEQADIGLSTIPEKSLQCSTHLTTSNPEIQAISSWA